MNNRNFTLRSPDNKLFHISNTVTSAVETGGYVYRDCKILTMIFKTEPEIVTELLPPPLISLVSEQMVIVFSLMNGTCPSGRQMAPYHEIVLGIPAMTENIPGLYCVQLYLDQINPGSQVYPVMAGQLVYGYPKREAQIRMSFNDATVSVNANRYDQEIVNASFTLESDLPIPEDQSVVYQYGLKYIPSIEEGGKPDVARLNRWSMKPGTPSVMKVAKPKSIINRITLDTGRIIPVIEILDISYALTGFEFGYGEVVWDYV